jgi:hypothetical protein
MANLVKARDAKLWVFQNNSDDCQATESAQVCFECRHAVCW